MWRSREAWVNGARRAAEVIALAGLIFELLVIAMHWGELPERIPVHFGVSGDPDAWGSRKMLLLLPLVSGAMYLFLTLLARSPQHFNYPFEITQENAERQYAIGQSLVAWVKAEAVWLFAIVTWVTCRVAVRGAGGLGAAFLPSVIVVLFGTIVLHLTLARRAR